MGQEKDLDKLFELICDLEVCMLTTLDGEGHLRSRPMATQTQAKGEDLWFFTRAAGGKAEEIEENSTVNLSYSAPNGKKFVSISGRATVEKNRAKMKELWKSAYRAWFPEGLGDPQIALLRVRIEKAEYWDSPSGIVVHLIGFTKALFTRTPYHPGENRKLDHPHH